MKSSQFKGTFLSVDDKREIYLSKYREHEDVKNKKHTLKILRLKNNI